MNAKWQRNLTIGLIVVLAWRAYAAQQRVNALSGDTLRLEGR